MFFYLGHIVLINKENKEKEKDFRGGYRPCESCVIYMKSGSMVRKLSTKSGKIETFT